MSAELSLSPRVRRLLTAVDSFEKLQILCLTAGKRDEAWSALRLAGELHLSSDDLEIPLQELLTAGLLARLDGDQVRYAPPTAEVDASVTELIHLYRDQTLLVVRAITQRAIDKIRDSAAHTFADAFVLRRSKPREPDDG